MSQKEVGAICVKGKLTDEGVECQTLRSTEGELYTLVGDLNGFQNGDEVVVCGTIAGISFCMQGTTINVSWIGKEAPKAKMNVSITEGSLIMLTDEQAGQIVTDCIRAVSHVTTVDTTGSLDDAEISDQTRINNLIDKIVTDDDIGVPSQEQTVDDSEFENVDTDTIVNALINIVRDKSVPINKAV